MYIQTVITSKKDTSPIHWAKIAVSMDGKAVALVDKGGYLWGGTPDFKVGVYYILVRVPARVLYRI